MEGVGNRQRGGTAYDPRELRELPPVMEQLNRAGAQLARYRETLERVYGKKLRLHTHAVVCIGLERLAW